MESHIKAYQRCKQFTLACPGVALGLERHAGSRRVVGSNPIWNSDDFFKIEERVFEVLMES